jgi:pilus assembly protein CpaC
MHRMKRIRCRVLAGMATLAGMVCATAQAQPPAPNAGQPTVPLVDAKFDKTTGAVLVPLGGAIKLNPGNNKFLTDISVRGNEEVVTARPDTKDPKSAVLIGRLPGVTRIVMTFEDKTTATFDVLVQPDYDLLRSVIKRAAPTAAVEVLPGVGNVIILTGYVTRPEDRDLIVQIASSVVGGNVANVLSNIQIGGAQHVQIDVMVAQVDRTELRERGTSFGVSGTTFGISSVVGGLATSNVANNVVVGAGATAPLTVGANANIIAGIVPAQFVGALRALKTEGLAKFLAEPKVVAQTGRPTLLRAGGQQAILGPAAGINGPGVILEQVGTQLEVLPIVFGNGRIYLEVNPQFRSVNAGRGVTTAFGFTPGFNESSIRSSVTMESGQTFAIGGLIEHSVQGSVEKVPYLGDLPLLGAAFSNVRHEERETELLILVTPRLVDALDCNQLPKRVPGQESRSPDDYELFLESLIETPRGQRRPWNGWRYNAAYKSDPSYGNLPCSGPGCTGATVPASGVYVAPTPAAPANVMPISNTTPVEIPVLPAASTGDPNNPSQ